MISDHPHENTSSGNEQEPSTTPVGSWVQLQPDARDKWQATLQPGVTADSLALGLGYNGELSDSQQRALAALIVVSRTNMLAQLSNALSPEEHKTLDATLSTPCPIMTGTIRRGENGPVEPITTIAFVSPPSENGSLNGSIAHAIVMEANNMLEGLQSPLRLPQHPQADQSA